MTKILDIYQNKLCLFLLPSRFSPTQFKSKTGPVFKIFGNFQSILYITSSLGMNDKLMSVNCRYISLSFYQYFIKLRHSDSRSKSSVVKQNKKLIVKSIELNYFFFFTWQEHLNKIPFSCDLPLHLYQGNWIVVVVHACPLIAFFSGSQTSNSKTFIQSFGLIQSLLQNKWHLHSAKK